MGSPVVRVVNETSGAVLGERVTIARTLWARTRGLMLQSRLPEGTGLIIDPCSSIHTFWMRIPIDVVYLDRARMVVRTDEAMRPWRIGPLRTGGRMVLELPVGAIARTGTRAGDRIRLETAE